MMPRDRIELSAPSLAKRDKFFREACPARRDAQLALQIFSLAAL